MPNQLNLIWVKGVFGKTNHYVNSLCFDIWPNELFFILKNFSGDFLIFFLLSKNKMSNFFFFMNLIFKIRCDVGAIILIF
jgi:hypothetical protein